MTVQIIRFKDGLDVICNMDDLGEDIEIGNPMVFEIRNTNLILQQWLPLAVMQGDSVNIKKREILCTMQPNPEFAEYYENTVEKMKSVIKKSKDSKIDNENMELIESLIEMEINDATKH